MARIEARTLKERRELEMQREREILTALSSRKKALESSKRDKKQKRKTASELLALLELHGIEGRTLRPVDTYMPRSYNLDRQLQGLVGHLFVRYPVPAFLYQACLPGEAPFDYMRGLYRQWLVTLAQGGSFPKLVKGVMTSREANAFLAAPVDHRIHENVWWARMKVAGLPEPIIERLIERLFGHYFFDDPDGRLAEAIQFYTRYHAEMDRVTFGEISDFLAWKLQNDTAFRLTGRTLTSVIRLTNEWHVLMQKAKLGHNVEWKGLELSAWEYEARDRVWEVVELRNNKELLNEGRKQKHCVYSYVHWCVCGRSAIFSLRAYRKTWEECTADGRIVWDRQYELTRVTIEVNAQRVVVQVRGPLNRPPTDEEKVALRMWAGEKGLVLKL